MEVVVEVRWAAWAVTCPSPEPSGAYGDGRAAEGCRPAGTWLLVGGEPGLHLGEQLGQLGIVVFLDLELGRLAGGHDVVGR